MHKAFRPLCFLAIWYWEIKYWRADSAESWRWVAVRQGVGGPNAQGQTEQQQLDWYKLIYSITEDNINSGGPLKVTTCSLEPLPSS